METQRVTFQNVLQWTEDQCREFLETMRWPDGPVCPKCGETVPYRITRKSASKNAVRSLYRCRACKRQYTATVGTIFEDSKLPLNKWFAAIYLMCSSKKGVSAHQVHRTLGVTYKSAWFMCHRIREAMRDKGDLSLLSGTIEADETYVGGKRRGHWTWHEREQDEIAMGLREKRSHPRSDKAIVFGILERDGRVRTMKVQDVTADGMQRAITGNVDLPESRLMTDGHAAYRNIGRWLPHQVIRHESEYVRGDIHTQGIENYWSLLKRGLYGVFQHVDEGYLGQYLAEFQYRFNHRKVSDAERFAALMAQTQGRLLWYCQTPQPQNPHA